MAHKRKYARPKDPRKLNPRLRRELRARVLAMYDICALCGREVDKTLPSTHPLSPNVDEIVPVSRGGSPYDIDNLQLTHKICNQRKGNRLPEDGLKNCENPTPTSRAW